MASDRTLSIKLVKLLEGVRVAEGMSFPDFVTHFDISGMSYYRWRRAARDGKAIELKLSTVQRGLDSLGYNAYIIIAKADK